MAIGIEAYLNSLPSDIDKLNISFGEFTYIPDLSRFTKLRVLECSGNKLTELPSLPETLEQLDCSFNELTSLPPLNKNLKLIFCFNNKLTTLPILNENLMVLSCGNNKLTIIPPLNKNLVQLYCINNNIVNFKLLNEKLKYFDYYGNPIRNIINSRNITIIKKQNHTLNNFKFLFYSLKYKNKFRYWLWERVRKPKIEKQYSPEMLNRILDNLENSDDEDELHNKINNW
jgi:hypothetical protein